MGDAHMRPEDAEITATAVRASLEQLIDHASGRDIPSRVPHAPAAPAAPDPLDVCRSTVMPPREEGQRATPEAFVQAVAVLRTTPVPGLSPGLGAMPRFRAEVGPFLGFAGSMEARTVDGGYVPEVADNGALFGADLSFRAGLGLDGVLGESGDGLVFASVGLHGDTDSTNDIPTSSPGVSAAGGVAAVRSRFGISTRLRMPFYLVPGDLLLLAPLYFFSPDDYTDMAVTASNGGLIPWQNGWATRIGRFQFVLGRELGATFYGYGLENSTLVPGALPDGEPTGDGLQVDLLRPADPRVPALPGVRHQAELRDPGAAVCRRRRAAEHHRDLSPGRAGSGARYDLLGRRAPDLRLAPLLLRAGGEALLPAGARPG